MDFDLYLITDRKQLGGDVKFQSRRLLSAVRQALKGGVKAVQLREKDLETRKLLKLAQDMRKLTKEYKAKLFINDRFDIALAVKADGVHLTQNSIPVDVVRNTVQRSLLIGMSTHSLKEARDAEKGGADFITLGPVYRTPSKVKYGAPLGTDRFSQIIRKLKIPAYALGGVKGRRIKEVKKAGAYGVAMISEIFNADNIYMKSRELEHMLEN